MANLLVKDYAAATKEIKATGDGSNGDPFIVQHSTTLLAGTAEIGKLAAGTAGIGKLTANSGVDIGDVDVTSVVPGVAATSLGKAEDAAHSSSDVGVMALAVRQATATDLSAGNTDGDYEPLQVDASGRLWVNVGSVTAGTAASSLGKAEDAAHTSGDVGVMALAVRAATATDRSAGGTDGDYEPLGVDANGRLHVTVGAMATMADAFVNPSQSKLGSMEMKFNGATWDLVRVANTYTSLSALNTASIVTAWTPASGKKFRLMGGTISASTAISILFEDNAAGAGNFLFRTPVLVAATPYTFDLGNGKLSAVADQVLKATGSGAGTITGTLWGTEE